MRILLAVLLLVGAPAVGQATAWLVARDGSGDFTTIQPAVDAAAPGDTILIAAGRYTERQTVTLHGWEWPIEVYVLVHTDNLTFVGLSRDEVVIGPDTAEFVDFGPNGIVFEDVARGDVRSLTAINMYGGIYTEAASVVEDCRFLGCGHGVAGFCAGSLVVSRCDFQDSQYIGVVSFDPTTRFEVLDSTFEGNEYAVVAVTTPNVSVRNCVIQGGNTGIQFEKGSVGEIVGCHISDCFSTGLDIAQGASANLVDNTVRGGQVQLRIESGPVTGTGNILHGGSYSTVRLYPAVVTLHGNHILAGGGYLAMANSWLGAPEWHYDLRDNYWGIADRDSIAALILDGYDDPLEQGFIDFQPFSTVPLPSERQSLGGVKNLYRPGRR